MSETPHRYTAELAGQIEVAWQDRWAERGTFHAPNPVGPWADPRGRRRVPRRAPLRPGHVPVPVRRRACTSATRSATSPPTSSRRFHRMRGQQRAARDGLRRVRPARRAVRGADRPAPAHDHRGRTSSIMRAPAAPPGPGPRRPPRVRHHRRRLLPLDAVDLPADLQLLVRRRAVRADGGRGRPARSPSWSPSSTPAPAPLPAGDGRDVGRAERRRARRRRRRATGWPTLARRRSTGAPGWARCWPTRRSPPTAAASAATSRCSSATCGSG